MKETISIPLRDGVEISEIIDFFKKSKLTRKMKISTIHKDHPYGFNYPNGLYISFAYLTLSQEFFLFSFAKQIANILGEVKQNPKDSSLCHYYKVNAENYLLVDLKGAELPVEKIILHDNKIISKMEATELFERLRGGELDADSTNVELFKLINRKLRDPQESQTNFLTRFILHYFTEQRELILIYKSISALKESKSKKPIKAFLFI